MRKISSSNFCQHCCRTERKATSNCNRSVRVGKRAVRVGWGGRAINFISQSLLTTRGNCGSLFKERQNRACRNVFLKSGRTPGEPKGFWT
ncbi:hypothetical protein CEXT_289231 [Caerostris extrusa]|uniref:Uncharacterized protein n=1 Tax=Caerostris extrusa TaxID=172846 RepID=A0AAV4RQ92_CAEEX|nr:hypothetical protein CEXT_289231 [Caerostris extrusa]